jgi:hypothetical protein
MPPAGEDKQKARIPPEPPFLDEEADEEAEAPGEEIRGFLPELMRRTLTLGFTGLFLTEEAMRKALGDSVPREWMEFVLSQSERTRADLVDRLSREFGRAFSALDPVELLRRLFEGQTLEVSARIHFASPRESIRRSGAKVSMRRREDEEAQDEAEPE